MKLAYLLFVSAALAGTALAQGGSVAVKDIFTEAKFDNQISYSAAGKTIPKIVKEMGDKFDLRLMARLDVTQVGMKLDYKVDNIPLRQALKELAKSSGSVWKRNGDILLLAPDQKRNGSALAAGPTKRNPKKFHDFMDSFTTAQMDKAKANGELGWDDLTPSQQQFLNDMQGPLPAGANTNNDGQNKMKWRFKGNDGDITIVKGGATCVGC